MRNAKSDLLGRLMWVVSYSRHPHFLFSGQDGRLVWRFKAFLASKGYALRGPVGFVDVDAYTGEMLSGEDAAAEMIANATIIAGSPLSTNSKGDYLVWRDEEFANETVATLYEKIQEYQQQIREP